MAHLQSRVAMVQKKENQEPEAQSRYRQTQDQQQ